MRVLIIHMRYWPDATGTGPLVSELAEDLAAQGDDVSAVTSIPHYGRSSIPSEFRGRIIHRSTRAGVALYRTFALASHVASPFGRAADYAAFTASSALTGIALGRQDVILCVAPPITVGFSGWLVGALVGAPMIFNAQDIWPDGLISMGRIRARPAIRVLRTIEHLVYRASRRITVVSEGMRGNLIGKGVAPDRVVVIPNWVDTNAIQPQTKHNAFREENGLSNRFVVLFAGNLGYAAGLETVVSAAELLRTDRRICFLLVGEGSAKSGLKRQAEELGLTNVVFLTTQPRDRLPEVLASADLSLVTLKKDMGTLSVPSKSYAIMASARPILAAVPADSEVVRLVTQADCGVIVPPEEPEALAAAIRSLAGDLELLEAYGRNGRYFVERHHSRADLTSRYHKLLLEVTSPEASGGA